MEVTEDLTKMPWQNIAALGILAVGVLLERMV
jgi:hypothetical protein